MPMSVRTRRAACRCALFQRNHTAETSPRRIKTCSTRTVNVEALEASANLPLLSVSRKRML